MGGRRGFKEVLSDKEVPILTLDQKWHQLFELNGKPVKIRKLEEKLNKLLANQAHVREEFRDLKNLKSKLMDNIVLNMKGTEAEQSDTLSAKRLEEDGRLIDEINQKISDCEEKLREIPEKIDECNHALMLETMDFCYHEMKNNKEQIKMISEWIDRTRKELKKNVVIRQNREIMNRQMYSYMHDIFGADVIDIFDLEYRGLENDSDEDVNEDGDEPENNEKL